MSDGIDAHGTQFLRGDGATPEVFAAIARVSNIEPPQLKRDTQETTAHDSPDGYKTFQGGLVDAGDVGIDLIYNPNIHDVLVSDLNDNEPRNYRIVFPTTPSATWSFEAVMTEFSSKAPYDDKLTASVKFKVSGKPTIS